MKNKADSKRDKGFPSYVIHNIEKLKNIMKKGYIEGDWPNYSEQDDNQTKAIGKSLVEISGTKEILLQVMALVDKENKYCTGYLEYVWEDLLFEDTVS